MSDTLTFTAEMDREELNKPRPAVWCDRCQCVHPAREAGSFDRHIGQQARKLADIIDARLLAKWKAQEATK